MISRRGLITGLISLAASPAIVRVESLMPVKVMEPNLTLEEYHRYFVNKFIRELDKHIKDSILYDNIFSEINYESSGIVINTIHQNKIYRIS